MTNLHGSCLAKDLVNNVGLMAWGTLVLEMGSGKSITLAPAFRDRKPGLATGQGEADRELAPGDSVAQGGSQ